MSIDVRVPGFGLLALSHLVLDFNGTLAIDGRVRQGVKQRLARLSRSLHIHVVTADTFGKARASLANVDCTLRILADSAEDRAKAAYVRRLGAARVVCIGNGRNDRLMLRTARLGLAVLQAEGAAARTLSAADLVLPSIVDALELLAKPQRLVASLRS